MTEKENLKDILGGLDLNSITSLKELENIASAIERIERRTFLDYTPHEKQRLFHLSDKKIRLFLAGNRAGKSTAGIEEDLFHATGQYPDWYPETGKMTPPTRGRIICTDFANGMGSVIMPKIAELLPSDRIKRVNKSPQGIIVKYILNNGSIIDILTHEQDTALFEGWSGNFCHFDEPPPRDKYIACQRGLVDFNGRCWFTLTPLSEAWIYDELYESKEDEIFVVEASIYDNPYLSKSSIESFERSLTPDEKEARIKGKFMHLTGLVYKQFNPDIHIINDFEIPQDWRIGNVIDPHDRKPHAIIWFAVDPFDTVYFCDELEINGTIKETSDKIKIKEGKKPATLRIIDPNKGKSPAKVGSQVLIVDEFAHEGLYYNPYISDNIVEGHLNVQKYLMYDKTKPIDSFNHPKMYVFRSCRKIIHSLTHYIWDDSVKDGSRDVREKPKDLNKDFSDCVRYALIVKPRYQKDDYFVRSRQNSLTGY
jgi:hypothetical protein